MKKLIDYFKSTYEKCELSEENLVKEFLEFSQKNNFIVEIVISDSGYNDVIGYVKEISENACIITNIDNYGKVDGESVMLFENITQLSCDTIESLKLKILNKN